MRALLVAGSCALVLAVTPLLEGCTREIPPSKIPRSNLMIDLDYLQFKFKSSAQITLLDQLLQLDSVIAATEKDCLETANSREIDRALEEWPENVRRDFVKRPVILFPPVVPSFIQDNIPANRGFLFKRFKNTRGLHNSISGQFSFATSGASSETDYLRHEMTHGVLDKLGNADWDALISAAASSQAIERSYGVLYISMGLTGEDPYRHSNSFGRISGLVKLLSNLTYYPVNGLCPAEVKQLADSIGSELGFPAYPHNFKALIRYRDLVHSFSDIFSGTQLEPIAGRLRDSINSFVKNMTNELVAYSLLHYGQLSWPEREVVLDPDFMRGLRSIQVDGENPFAYFFDHFSPNYSNADAFRVSYVCSFLADPFIPSSLMP